MSPQPRVSIPRHRPGVPSQTPLLNSSTITFFASWRGQLMICGIAILLGGICFILQEPYAKFRRRRREALSKAREKELISMETEKVDSAGEDVKEKEKRGKEKRKDVKKRKGSLLRVPAAAAGSGESSVNVSSIESSPAPSNRLALPGVKSRSSSCASAKSSAFSSTVSSALSSTTPQSSPNTTPSQSLLEPSPIIQVTPSRPSPLLSPRSVDPRDLPLPVSPVAGPSRLSYTNGDHDLESIDGDSGSTSESASSNNMNGEVSMAKAKPTPTLNFSIIPEEGYLPVQAPPMSGTKKKKRKGRTAPPGPLPSIERRSARSDPPGTPGTSRPVGLDSPTVPVTPSRHARKASLTRPPNADLEALLTERERTIEALRAEIGLAKAEEAKARDLVTRMSVTEERLKGDFERARKASQRSDHESRKREGELNARLTHISSQFTAALHRINVLESMFRESGQPFPPVSPGLPPGHSPGLPPGPSPGPISAGHLHPMPSPLPPSSPYGMGYGPSPRAVSAGFVPFPSPAMYPSPMLHPHFGHPSHPSPFRRASTAGVDESSLAGPLTPGHPTVNGSGNFPFDLGIMPSPSPAQPMPNGNGPLSAADLRRMSIESSVMKKKKDAAKSDSESGEESHRGLEALPDVEETDQIEIHGLGMGELDVGGSDSMQRSDLNAESGSGSSHPSSPSPPTRASMLLTPASADVFRHQALVQGTETPEEFGLRESISDMSEIKMIPDAENGNLYYTTVTRRADIERETGSDDASAYEPRENSDNGADSANGDGDHVQGCFDEPLAMDAGKEDYVPMFASIAHTPQQVQEIKQMQQKQEKAIRGSRSSSRQGSVIG